MLRVLNRFLRVVVLCAFIAAAVLQVAATGNAEQSALTIASVVAAASPFVIQFAKSVLHLSWDGKTMLAAASVVALGIALAALQFAGRLNLNDPVSIVATIATAFTLQQLVFQALKDSPKVGPLLK